MAQANVQDLSSVVDYQQLLVRCLNNLEFAERMLKLFQEQGGKEMAVLEEAFDRGDTDAVRRIAHRLAGASANAAAFGMQRCASELRTALAGGSQEQANQCMDHLRSEWSRWGEVMPAN